MNRADLQQLAENRVADAAALLAAGRFPAAYYLVGYAVECGLKACIAKQVRAEDFPAKQLAIDSYSHDFRRLAKTGDVLDAIEAHVKADAAFSANWATALEWDEATRYDQTSEQDARALFDAVTVPTAGVLQWLKTFW